MYEQQMLGITTDDGHPAALGLSQHQRLDEIIVSAIKLLEVIEKYLQICLFNCSRSPRMS